MSGPPRVLVVGHGMVGSRFVEEVLARRGRPPVDLTVLGDEPYGPYNRVLLSEVVAGRADVAALAIGRPGALAAAGVAVRAGTAAVAVDRRARTVLADDGSAHPYDLLVLATGARPVRPPVEGLAPDTRGVRTFRTVDDCREIVAAAGNAPRVAVLGGGVLGLEAARGLAGRGLAVTLVHPGGHLLDRQLDAGAGAVLGAAVRRLGIGLRLGRRATAVETAHGHVRALVLDGGERVPADLLVLACGVRPDTSLVPDLAGPTGGVAVDDRMHALGDPHVAALGDCAEHAGRGGGLVAPGWAQARVLADLVTGADPAARYAAAPPALRLKAAGLDVAAAGEPADLAADPWAADLGCAAGTGDPTGTPTGDPIGTPTGQGAGGTEVVQLADPARGAYAKAVLRGGRVVAAVVVGAPRTASELLLLVERGSPAPAGRAALLLPHERTAAAATGTDDPTRIPDRATICRCNGVTKGAIVAAWSDGARSLATLAARTRATTGCGGCRDATCGLLEWLDAAAPAPLSEPDIDSQTDPESRIPAPPQTPAPAGGTR